MSSSSRVSPRPRPPLSGTDGLLRALEEVVGDPHFVPPVLPSVAFRLQELIARGESRVGEVISVIETDPLVAADLLRVAQSPFYARRRPPANLQDAILLLGFEEVRNLVWQIGLSGKVFRAAAFQATMASLRRHSVATAHLARLVGSAASQDLEDIFLAGLLHDAGLAVSLVAVADRQEDIPPEVTTAEMDAVLHEFHEGAGAILGALWELASPLCEVLTDHHGAGPQGPSRLAACVVVGQSLANAHGAFVRHEDGTPYSTDPPEVVADARRALGLTDDDTFESLAVDARILLDELPFA